MCVELSKNVVLVIHNPIQYRFEKYCPLKLLLTLREDGWQIKKKFCDFLARLREFFSSSIKSDDINNLDPDTIQLQCNIEVNIFRTYP